MNDLDIPHPPLFDETTSTNRDDPNDGHLPSGGNTVAAARGRNEPEEEETNVDTSTTTTTYSEFLYESEFDTDQFRRSAAANFMHPGQRQTSFVFAMVMGNPEYQGLDKRPPFSSTKKKEHTYIFRPINTVLLHEVLRRAHFIARELPFDRQHPFRRHGKIQMPRPASWNTERLHDWLHQHTLVWKPQDEQFLKQVVDTYTQQLTQALLQPSPTATGTKPTHTNTTTHDQIQTNDNRRTRSQQQQQVQQRNSGASSAASSSSFHYEEDEGSSDGSDHSGQSYQEQNFARQCAESFHHIAHQVKHITRLLHRQEHERSEQQRQPPPDRLPVIPATWQIPLWNHQYEWVSKERQNLQTTLREREQLLYETGEKLLQAEETANHIEKKAQMFRARVVLLQTEIHTIQQKLMDKEQEYTEWQKKVKDHERDWIQRGLEQNNPKNDGDTHVAGVDDDDEEDGKMPARGSKRKHDSSSLT
jgi:hypothetical protein